MTAPRVSVLVERLGPYHAARLSAVARRTDDLELTVLEVASGSTRYAWAGAREHVFSRDELFPGADYLALRPSALREAVTRRLEASPPAVVVVNGWGFPESRAAIAWAAGRRRPVVLFSDSHEHDAPRVAWREAVKRRIVGACSSALVAGRLHAEYVMKLGMPAGRVVTGYDVVDNAHFERGAAAARAEAGLRARLGVPDRYFLACARMVPKKNLVGLVDAYGSYRANTSTPWGLVIVGDGPGRSELEAAIARAGLTGVVGLPGFAQYDALPAWYGLASAFVLPSTVEQWGLVVNEAMASGLPVLISRTAGCAPELLRDGVNGFGFDPARPAELAERMAQLAALGDPERERFGLESRALVARLTPETFADALVRAVGLAVERGPTGGRFSLARWLP